MQFTSDNAAATPQPMEPVNINLVLETPDDVRWFYHAMNMQPQEVAKAYQGNRLGNFEDRFRSFEAPEGKKAVFRYIKQVAADNSIQL